MACPDTNAIPIPVPLKGASISGYGMEPTSNYVRCWVAMRWKADFEQAASVIVLCARQGASLRQRRCNKECLFGLMGRDNSLLA